VNRAPTVTLATLGLAVHLAYLDVMETKANEVTQADQEGPPLVRRDLAAPMA